MLLCACVYVVKRCPFLTHIIPKGHLLMSECGALSAVYNGNDVRRTDSSNTAVVVSLGKILTTTLPLPSHNDECHLE